MHRVAISPLPRGSAMLLVLPALADRPEDMTSRPDASVASDATDATDTTDATDRAVGPD